ncbi:hypothetical protein ACS0TY_015266 [Phlomoides rotata]
MKTLLTTSSIIYGEESVQYISIIQLGGGTVVVPYKSTAEAGQGQHGAAGEPEERIQSGRTAGGAAPPSAEEDGG